MFAPYGLLPDILTAAGFERTRAVFAGVVKAMITGAVFYAPPPEAVVYAFGFINNGIASFPANAKKGSLLVVERKGSPFSRLRCYSIFEAVFRDFGCPAYGLGGTISPQTRMVAMFLFCLETFLK